MSGITWLSSYPKSGNTWLRTLLSNYLSESDEPVSINQLKIGSAGYLRHDFDEYVGIDSADMTYPQIIEHRPYYYEQLAAEITETIYLKIHDAFENSLSGKPIFPATATKGVIYLIRNPLDVVVSLAHHRNSEIDEAIRFVGDRESFMVGPGVRVSQLPQRMGSWSEHVKGWMDQEELRVHLVRYEDMYKDTTRAFREILEFLNLDVDPVKLSRAVDFSDFSVLKGQETKAGFVEKQSNSESFFRQGKSGTWREVLNNQQISAILRDHREMMDRFGYLEEL